MKNLILFILILTAFVTTSKNEVYYCDSKGGKKYHYTKTCKGLSNCKHTIKETTVSQAKTMGLTLCGWED